MKIRYCAETDTAYVEFYDKGVIADTIEINDKVLLELDLEGRLVSVTMKQAGNMTDAGGVSIDRILPERVSGRSLEWTRDGAGDGQRTR